MSIKYNLILVPTTKWNAIIGKIIKEIHIESSEDEDVYEYPVGQLVNINAITHELEMENYKHILAHINDYIQPQHLYLVSGEKIVKGNQYIRHGATQELNKVEYFDGIEDLSIISCSKIICTTDVDMIDIAQKWVRIKCNIEDTYKIPTFSEAFVSVYISKYNWGEPLTFNVDVATEIAYEHGVVGEIDHYIPAVDKDNIMNVLVKPMKPKATTYSEAQLIKIVNAFNIELGHVPQELLDAWVVENL